jgi:hypothetical protein
MGDAFDDEEARGLAFNDAMGRFLQGVHGAPRLHGHKTSHGARRVYRLGQRCMIFQEDKGRDRHGRGSYTQVARSYVRLGV